MEFKKIDRYRSGRPTLTVPERSDPVSHPPVTPDKIVTPPKKKSLRDRLTILFKNKRRRSVYIGAISLIVAVLVIVLVNAHHETKKVSINTATAAAPSYATILPSGSSITSLGGWQKVSPAKSDPVYAYVDSISGTAISVSEQPLPKSLQTDTSDQIAQLAKAYNATDVISAGSTQVYIGTSAKGPQSVIFTEAGLLVLIKSEKEISNTAWTTYISSLK